MSEIYDMVKRAGSTDSLIIEQKLNSLFYLPPKPEEELEFLEHILNKHDNERVGLHASAIIASDNEFCYREQVLSLFYKQSQGQHLKVELKRVFEEGNAIHEKWQRLFIRGGLGKPKNMDRSTFIDEYDLSYTPDARIKLAKKKRIVEIKSMNTFAFKHATSHPSGKKQLMFYMYLDGVKDGFVLAEDKNTQEFKIFPYIFNEKEVEPYIIRLENIQKYKKRLLKNKKMVDGICKNSSCKRALKCNMRDACFNIGEGRKRL